jgi:hypothetical protein
MMLMESSAIRARELRRFELLEDPARARMTASAVVSQARIPISVAWLAAWTIGVYRAVTNLETRPRVSQAERSAHGAG